jgi:two-component system, OmpR family, phosphate regulon sensor histidine kinase PhoR
LTFRARIGVALSAFLLAFIAGLAFGALTAQIVLVTGGLLIAISSVLYSRSLRSLATQAREIARGSERRIDAWSGNEIGDIGGSLNRMAEDIERTVAALARERALLAAVLEGMSQGIIALDADRRVTVMNREAVAMLGLEAAPIGKPLIDHVRLPAIQEIVAAPEQRRAAEITVDGNRRLTISPTPFGAGGCILAVEDVTDIRRLETIRRDFVANVSHELRTPVSVIRANAETLLDGASTHPVHGPRLLGGLHRNAERLSNIINDLLDLARLEAGQTRIAPVEVDIGEVAGRAVASVADTAAKKKIELAIDAGPGVRTVCDGRALEQVLVNLIDNAIKYTPAGGHVWVAVTSADGSIRIEVQDDGPGISPAHRERIFERFYRVDPGRSRDMGGTGLGLSIVRHLMTAMDGEVGVEPRAPSGSIFWVRLPPRRAAASA